MTRFSYKALTPAGDVMSGTGDAENENALRDDIAARGLLVVEVASDHVASSDLSVEGLRLFGQRLFAPRPRAKDVTEFLQQLATLLQASIRLDYALDLLSDPHLSGTMAQPVRDIRRAILSGEPLSAALARHHDLFPTSMQALIALAEQSGNLPNTMAAIAIERERTEKLRQKAADALAYPAFLLIAVTGVLSFFIGFVLPQFRPIISELGAKADPTLIALLDLSAFLTTHRIEVISGLMLTGIALYFGFRDRNRRDRMLDLILRAPYLRDIARDYRTARFCRNFGHLVERGIALTDAIDLSGKAISTHRTAVLYLKARDEVRQGRGVFTALENTHTLSPVALRMLRIGEETGRMPMIALKAADMFESRVERQIEKLVGLIGPIAILLVSVIVGGLIVSVMTALMSVNQLVG